MTEIIAAQIFGLLGYSIYILSPQCKTQKAIVQSGIIGYALLSVQWYLLAQPALIVLNMIAVTTSLYALGVKQSNILQRLYPALYPCAIFLVVSVSSGTLIDVLCIMAAILSIRSRLSEDLKSFRLYAISAGILLTITGGLALSAPALIFNTLFTVSHAQKLRIGRRQTRSSRIAQNASAQA